MGAHRARVLQHRSSSGSATTGVGDDAGYCFFDEHESKTGRPVKRNLNATKAKARSATLMSIIAVIALRKGLSRKP